VFLVKGPKKHKNAPGASPRYYGAPVAMALYNQGSGIPGLPMNRMCPQKRGQGWRKGGGGRSINQEISRWNMTIRKKAKVEYSSSILIVSAQQSSAAWVKNSEQSRLIDFKKSLIIFFNFFSSVTELIRKYRRNNKKFQVLDWYYP
jgi:hypothetical protein